jgi:hypothetical protein
MSILQKFLSFLDDIDDYEIRKVARDEILGLKIDTAFTSDYGYETAIIDKNGTYPVERYIDCQSSIDGHKKWVEWCKDKSNIKVISLGGFDGLIKDREIILER